MATLASAAAPTIRSDHKFFLIMACAMAAVIVAGFGLNLAMGRSNFGLPLLYHVHAFVFFGWVALYLTQNVLVANGYTVLRYTAHDVQTRLGSILKEIAEMVRRLSPAS